jgi:hypothetical protein
MQTETLDKWVRADRARGPWLAKRLGYSREYIRLMARGARPIPRSLVPAIREAMKAREGAEALLK